MTAENKKYVTVLERAISVKRFYDAPRDLVFETFTSRLHLSNWWGPDGFTTTTHEMDVRPGGVWRFTMHGPDGTDYPNKIMYRHVDRPHRLSYEQSGGGSELVHLVEAIFEEKNGGTELSFEMTFESPDVLKDVEAKYGAAEGAEQTFERLAVLLGKLASGDTLVIERIFDAPRELVFKAWTEPERVARWWGPREFSTPVCEIEAKTGGKWRFAMRGPDGRDIWCGGEYRDVVFPELIVTTDYFADENGNPVYAPHYGMSAEFPLEMLITVTFEDLGGKTKMTVKHFGLPPTPDGRGANDGWGQSFDKLAEYLSQA